MGVIVKHLFRFVTEGWKLQRQGGGGRAPQRLARNRNGYSPTQSFRPRDPGVAEGPDREKSGAPLSTKANGSPSFCDRLLCFLSHLANAPGPGSPPASSSWRHARWRRFSTQLAVGPAPSGLFPCAPRWRSRVNRSATTLSKIAPALYAAQGLALRRARFDVGPQRIIEQKTRQPQTSQIRPESASRESCSGRSAATATHDHGDQHPLQGSCGVCRCRVELGPVAHAGSGDAARRLLKRDQNGVTAVRSRPYTRR